MGMVRILGARQSQALVMTPQLQESLKLLQLSNQAATEYVVDELESNPLLDLNDLPNDHLSDEKGEGVDDDGNSFLANGEDEPGNSADVVGQSFSETTELEGWIRPGREREARSDDGSLTDRFQGSFSFSDTGVGRRFEGDDRRVEDQLTEAPSLRDYLLRQLQLEFENHVDRLIGTQFINGLDEAGYLSEDLNVLADRVGCGPNRVQAVLERLQKFEPAGIFARSLKECLALQLAERGRLDPPMTSLLSNLELLARREVTKLKDVCRVGDDKLVAMVAEIRSLNPKPGAAFDDSDISSIVPDVLMYPHPEDGWFLEMNSDTLPKILINNNYYSSVLKECTCKKEREYVSECFKSANWLTKALHQRAVTILKVATEIVRQQDAFFQKGVEYMHPLTLRDVAETIGMHESTVSRVTNNKYISTPRGTFELKYFFSAAIPSANGDEVHSAKAVRGRIGNLIKGEETNDVLSDDKIVRLLRDDGIDIARRTVAKYRQTMGIPSSAQRRREKNSPI